MLSGFSWYPAQVSHLKTFADKPAAGARPMKYAPAPRWVKVSGCVVAAIVLLMVIAMLTGHGPGRHFGAGPSPMNPAGDGAASAVKK